MLMNFMLVHKKCLCATTMATPYRVGAALLFGQAFLEGLVSRSIHPMPSFPGLQVLATKDFCSVWHEPLLRKILHCYMLLSLFWLEWQQSRLHPSSGVFHPDQGLLPRRVGEIPLPVLVKVPVTDRVLQAAGISSWERRRKAQLFFRSKHETLLERARAGALSYPRLAQVRCILLEWLNSLHIVIHSQNCLVSILLDQQERPAACNFQPTLVPPREPGSASVFAEAQRQGLASLTWWTEGNEAGATLGLGALPLLWLSWSR